MLWRCTLMDDASHWIFWEGGKVQGPLSQETYRLQMYGCGFCLHEITRNWLYREQGLFVVVVSLSYWSRQNKETFLVSMFLENCL